MLEPSVSSAQGGASRGQDVPRCSHCGRKHKGDCRRLTGACLGCGSMEHKIRECNSAMFHKFRKAAKVLHRRVFQDKGHRIWLDKMVVL